MNEIKAIVVFDDILIQIEDNKCGGVLEHLDVNELKHKLCYGLLNARDDDEYEEKTVSKKRL